MLTRGITINASGYAIAPYDYASICIFSRAQNKIGSEAKRIAATHSKKVLETLREFGIPDTAIKSSFKLNESSQYFKDEGEKVIGYKATHHITVFVNGLETMADLQDSLTNIPNVEVEAPKLHLAPATKEKMQELAFTRAFEKGKRRLQHECQVLGLKVDDYVITGYGTDYKHNYREEMAGDISPSSNDILEFHAGTALVEVSLNIWYRHKDAPN